MSVDTLPLRQIGTSIPKNTNDSKPESRATWNNNSYRMHRLAGHRHYTGASFYIFSVCTCTLIYNSILNMCAILHDFIHIDITFFTFCICTHIILNMCAILHDFIHFDITFLHFVYALIFTIVCKHIIVHYVQIRNTYINIQLIHSPYKWIGEIYNRTNTVRSCRRLLLITYMCKYTVQ